MQTIYKEYPIESVVSIKALVSFFRRTFPADYYFHGESHDFAEVVCVTGGKIGVTADKNVYALSAGQMIVHTPNEFHSLWPNNEEAEIIVFSFYTNAFPALSKRIFSMNTAWISELGETYERAKEALAFEDNQFLLRGALPEKETEAAIVVKQLEIFLLKVLSTDNSAEPRYSSQSAENYARIVNAMEEALGAPLNIDELAKRCKLSVSAIEKTVHRYMGCGAITYFNNLRMKRAAMLLEAGRSVKEVAYALGFSSQNYFSSAFKKWAHRSPSSYRKQ